MKKLNKTYDELKKQDCFKNYIVKCDSEKYATAITSDGVLVCFYGSVVLDNITE